MSNQVHCEKIDNCFANARTYRYYLPAAVDEDFATRLGGLGSLFVKKNLRRPFFRIETESGVQIKGILGDSSVKVSFPEERWKEEKVIWEEQIAAIAAGK